MSPYIPRYPGPRWSIVYGSAEGVNGFALEELVRSLQSFLPYVIEVLPASQFQPGSHPGNLVLLGTPSDNLHINGILQQGKLSLPSDIQGFRLDCTPSLSDPSLHWLILAGNSSAGVLYAVETFIARVLGKMFLPESPIDQLRQSLDQLKPIAITETPSIPERGLWTWGYVIYDYRRFLDSMARLKFNCLTIWNDIPPVNARQLIDYAHDRGIKIILGFPWGWGMDFDLANRADRQAIQEMVLQHFRQHIQPLSPDGIYFQSLTEHNDLEMQGRSVASLTCELVNQVAQQLFALEPGIDIRFGLHATSIRQNYGDLAGLDPRLTIVWEDAGALPFTYTPSLEGQGLSFAQTLEYTHSLATFRPNSTFAMVAKGWTCLNWQDEFEHHGHYLLGVRSPEYTRRRLEKIQPRWDEVNPLWEQYLSQTRHFYQSIQQACQGRMSVIALVEDGLFEEKIQPSVALFAETLWNPFAESSEILTRADSAYYKRMI
jgi:hypothetical protein